MNAAEEYASDLKHLHYIQDIFETAAACRNGEAYVFFTKYPEVRFKRGMVIIEGEVKEVQDCGVECKLLILRRKGGYTTVKLDTLMKNWLPIEENDHEKT